ncbi:RmlC-like cupin [Thelephora terrestris]|uniref:RmlC-like cupin n=1 Tax=Thelephora terrestris TaxID=56493 RepID=A0A9P6HQI0_9AGAM|nr:RmlC-like cupin [Thelephora terrestris]
MKFSTFILTISAAACISAQNTTNTNATRTAELLEGLQKAPTRLARLNVLGENTDWLFDFTSGLGTTRSAGGNVTAANVANFPALFANGLAMTIGQMEPCGMNTPHTHPRATEILYLVNGEMEAGFIEENGARFVKNTLTKGQGTLFPQGSIHYQTNTGCDPVLFVAVLNNEDPGSSQIAQRFFGLPPNVTQATLGDIGLQEVNDLSTGIPDSMAIGLDQCLQKCGLTRGNQTMGQQQPRTSDNALSLNMK